MARAPYESSRGWQQAMALTVWVYRLTRKLPDHEKSGLCGAMRKSATAAAQRIADADGRADVNDAIKHYEAALAALRELVTSGLICRRLRYLSGFDLMALRRRAARVEAWVDADLAVCEDERDAEPQPAPLQKSDLQSPSQRRAA
ncbi:MAG: four helix bundle protein [Planctomycetota bacterium]